MSFHVDDQAVEVIQILPNKRTNRTVRIRTTGEVVSQVLDGSPQVPSVPHSLSKGPCHHWGIKPSMRGTHIYIYVYYIYIYVYYIYICIL